MVSRLPSFFARFSFFFFQQISPSHLKGFSGLLFFLALGASFFMVLLYLISDLSLPDGTLSHLMSHLPFFHTHLSRTIPPVHLLHRPSRRRKSDTLSWSAVENPSASHSPTTTGGTPLPWLASRNLISLFFPPPNHPLALQLHAFSSEYFSVVRTFPTPPISISSPPPFSVYSI